MQVGTATGLADRYFQSFLVPGGISALGYVGLIVSSLSSLMTFREIYVVPLASETGREQKLERMLQGLVLISIPCSLFLVVYAEPIVSVLLQRGKFTPEAAAVTASILRIQSLGLLISTILAPLERMFQILDRLLFVQLRYLIAFIATLIFQSFFVFYLALDVQGVSWGWLCNAILVLCLVIVMVRHCGVVIRWRGIVANAAFAAATTVVAMGISWPVASRFSGLSELIMGGALYAFVIASSYFAARARLRLIVG
jgi:putative peptidoglycan lipid II flippase